MTDALGRELELAAESIRAEVRRRATAAEHSDASGRAIVRRDETPFTALRGEEVEAVRRAVRALVERLRGGEMVRARRAKRGRLDVSKTMRAAYRTGGVPFVPERRNRRRDKARLVLLCDVSDSVRAVSTFLLEFAYAAQDLFAKTRTFVFVSELGETTNLFESNPIQVALGRAYGGSVISVVDNSNYGRVFASFVERVLPSIDRRTTVVILGDGRTNFHDDGASHLDAIRERARSLVWLCPEPRSAWASGDSAMRRYAEKCSTVLSVRTVEELEVAARRLVALR
ncbi:MAG: VWA domain-containing protein [Polyangiaceae bacterium]